jgi:hypothetical protein
MRNWFREGFYVGLTLALVLAVYLIWLWGAEHQVRLHTSHLLEAMEDKSWARFASFMADDYHDQWGEDRALVLERSRAVFTYLRGVHIQVVYPSVQAENGVGKWQGNIKLETSDNDFGTVVKERVNSLPTPFTLEWRRVSGKPWDWKLVRVSNPSLEIPAGFE